MKREDAIKMIQAHKFPKPTEEWQMLNNEAIDMAIESLSANYTTEKPKDVVEQKNDVVAEPTDLISRADAIKAIESRQTEQWIDADVDYNNGLESAVAEIKALPSAKVSTKCIAEIKIDADEVAQKIKEKYDLADRPSGEWKPVSERLPQRVGSYIVTCKDEHGWVYVDYDYWTVADEFKYNNSKVTAWIPFPKPYCGADMRKEKNK